MEVFGARPEEPTTACLKEIDQSDLFVGIYAYRYGFVPPGSDRSITEQEFVYAEKLKKPLLCFVVDDDYPWPPKLIEAGDGARKLTEFKRRIQQGTVRDTFTSPSDLAYRIAASLGRHLTRLAGPTVQTAAERNPYLPQLRQSSSLADLLARTVRLLESECDSDDNQVFLAGVSGYAQHFIAVADVIARRKQRYRIATLGGLLGACFQTGGVLNVGDVRSRAGYFQAVPETRSELVVPVRFQGAVIGVLNSESEERDHFTAARQAAVAALADALGAILPDFGWSPGRAADDLPWIALEPQMAG
jgi:hypothetical protein